MAYRSRCVMLTCSQARTSHQPLCIADLHEAVLSDYSEDYDQEEVHVVENSIQDIPVIPN